MNRFLFWGLFAIAVPVWGTEIAVDVAWPDGRVSNGTISLGEQAEISVDGGSEKIEVPQQVRARLENYARRGADIAEVEHADSGGMTLGSIHGVRVSVDPDWSVTSIDFKVGASYWDPAVMKTVKTNRYVPVAATVNASPEAVSELRPKNLSGRRMFVSIGGETVPVTVLGEKENGAVEVLLGHGRQAGPKYEFPRTALLHVKSGAISAMPKLSEKADLVLNAFLSTGGPDPAWKPFVEHSAALENNKKGPVSRQFGEYLREANEIQARPDYDEFMAKVLSHFPPEDETGAKLLLAANEALLAHDPAETELKDKLSVIKHCETLNDLRNLFEQGTPELSDGYQRPLMQEEALRLRKFFEAVETRFDRLAPGATAQIDQMAGLRLWERLYLMRPSHAPNSDSDATATLMKIPSPGMFRGVLAMRVAHAGSNKQDRLYAAAKGLRGEVTGVWPAEEVKYLDSIIDGAGQDFQRKFRFENEIFLRLASQQTPQQMIDESKKMVAETSKRQKTVNWELIRHQAHSYGSAIGTGLLFGATTIGFRHWLEGIPESWIGVSAGISAMTGFGIGKSMHGRNKLTLPEWAKLQTEVANEAYIAQSAKAGLEGQYAPRCEELVQLMARGIGRQRQ